MRRSISRLAFLFALTTPATVVAQTAPRIDGGPWRPEYSVDPGALPWVEGTLVPGAGNWNVQTAVDFARRPVVIHTPSTFAALSRDQLWLTLGAQIGIGTRMAFAAQLPIMLYQASNGSSLGLPEANETALGDLRLVFRWTTRRELGAAPAGASGRTSSDFSQQQREQREGFGLSLNIAGTVPLGDPRSLASWGAPTAHLFGVFDFRLFRIFGSLSLGYRLRFDDRWPSQAGTCADVTSPACLFDVPQRDQITFGLAVRQPLEGLLALIFLGISPRLASASILAGNWVTTYLTLQGAIDARAPFASASGTPMELGAGLQSAAFGEFTLSLGAAWGLTAAPGAASIRAVATLQWAPRFIDEDHDGLRDDPAIDQCIGLAEDFDHFEDNDGCPEDNDHDAIPDEEDRCPTVDEDEDGFEDDDGCPDPDNDGDTIHDTDDQCPDEAQGEHPDDTRRGCPHSDRDRDGVSNTDDQCPDEAQGPTPDGARAGCPAIDRDHDGVPDPNDRCPDVPAGDGATPAQHGCPETDRDHDGVLDVNDRCAAQAETINGLRDNDGCPEMPIRPGLPVLGAFARVRVLRTTPDDVGTVVLLQAVRFTAADRVTPLSAPILPQLAIALRATSRVPTRWWELSVPTTAPTVRGPLAVNAERANRRRDQVIAALRALGVDEQRLRPGPAAPPVSPRVLATGGDRGIVLVAHDEP